MPISNQEAARIVGLATVERLQSDGMRAIEQGGNANAIADQLLKLSQQTGDQLVSEMAMLAQAGIASGQLAAAGTALASVNDQIATATNTFALAARLAQEGQSNLTFPFIAGKTASLLDLLQSLKKAITDSSNQIKSANGVQDLLSAFDAAQSSVASLKDKADKLVG
jgi:hypothetical protein